jgi:hypothetical protein
MFRGAGSGTLPPDAGAWRAGSNQGHHQLWNHVAEDEGPGGITRPRGETSGGVVRGSLLEAYPDELGSRRDPKLREHAPEVVLDRARTEEELGRNFLVRSSLCYQPCDLPFLARQSHGRCVIAAPNRLTGRPELAPGSLCPRGGAELLEGVEGGAKRYACLSPAAIAAELLAEKEERSGSIERPWIAVVEDQGFR